MKITIVGTGYVGLVTGACLAELGNKVFCLDLDQKKIDILNNGGMPIHEPGLTDLVSRNRAAGRLVFSTDVAASVEHGDIQFIAVGTPPDEDGSADLQYVLAAARNIGKYMQSFKVIVDKSTVPVGTAERVAAVVNEELAQRQNTSQFSVVSNPEFLKEGAAVDDFMRPDRIVVGCDHSPLGEKARILMVRLYETFSRDRECLHWMDVRSAEFTKYAANAMLATRISFMNELSNLADRLHVDIEAVRKGMGSDPRIGPSFLYAGCGYGGSCFPKDVQALEKTAQENGQQLHILHAVESVNDAQKKVLGQKILQHFGSDLSGKQFAVWGLAFKPDTDDMRAASSRVLINDLLSHGASLTLFDPVAMEESRRVLAIDFNDRPELLKKIVYADSAMEALQNADALVIVTEWKVFRSPDFDQLKASLKRPVIFDGRNLYEPSLMKELDIDYHCIGRAALKQNQV
ncbi:MAG: UDP-glucose/GDP-mannose dehydrogenase family protein [Burkholderiaceae bacterium]|nr:UDP-glucose/GDP-mannose dehydrogenase family protein [Burkholderiaceae bacterium]